MSRQKKKPGEDDSVGPSEGRSPSGPLPEEPETVDESTDAVPGAEVLLDRLMRLQAEYENFRKRVAREKLEWTGRAVESLVLDLLPVLDSFDRALAAAEESTDAKAVQDGMNLVMRQFTDALALNGVKPIEAKGESFDPNLHEAFLSRPVEEGEVPGILVEEISRGYRMGDRTIRPTRGIVTVAPEPEADSVSSLEDE